MKTLFAALALAAAMPAAAQDAPAAAPLTIDTPLAVVAADPKGKAVLDADAPGLTTHEMWDMFKGMSLKQLQPMSNGKLTDEVVAKVAADLAALGKPPAL